MLLYDLIEKCSYRDEYQKEHEQCEDCSYGKCCPRDCQSCLQYVHFPQNAPAPRKYDCIHMADCYCRKYAKKTVRKIILLRTIFFISLLFNFILIFQKRDMSSFDVIEEISTKK